MFIFVLLFSFYSCNYDSNNQNIKQSNFTSGKIYIPTKRIIVPEKLSFGNGYNSVTLEEYFNVINYESFEKSAELLALSKGNTGSIEIHSIENKVELKKILDVSEKVDLGLKFDGFSLDGNTKTTVYKESKFSRFEKKVVIKASYRNEPYLLLKPSMNSEILEFAKTNPKDFPSKYGDMFVSKIYTGGTQYAFLNSNYSNHWEQNITDKITDGNATIFDQNLVGNKTKKTILETSVINNLRQAYVFTEGGTNPKELKLENFVDNALSFKENVGTDQKPVVLFVELAPYESLPNFPQDIDFSPIRIRQKEFIERAIEDYEIVEEAANNARFVIEEKRKFDDKDFEKANELLKKHSDTHQEIITELGKCRGDFKNCELSKLPNIDFYKNYRPIKDFSNNIEVEREIKINEIPINQYIPIEKNTENEPEKYIFYLSGKIMALSSESKDERTCYKPVKEEFRETMSTRYQEVKWEWGGKKSHWHQKYLFYHRPYFKVRLTSNSDKNNYLEFDWNGKPFSLKGLNNYNLSIMLVNPEMRITYHDGGYKELERVKSKFTAISDCKEDLLTVKIGLRKEFKDTNDKNGVYSTALSDGSLLPTKSYTKNGIEFYDFEN